MAKTDCMQIEERRGYPWPASALTGVEMAFLATWRENTGIPISELLRQSVETTEKMIPANLHLSNNDMYVIIEFDPDKKAAGIVRKNSLSARVFESYDKAYEYVCDNLDSPYKIVGLGSN